MNLGITENMIELFLVLVILSAALIVTRRDILSFFRAYSLQSLGIAAIAFILFLQEKNIILLYMAILTLVSKVIIIPIILKKVQGSMQIHRDVEFHYLNPGGSIAATMSLILLTHVVFSRLLQDFFVSKFFYIGTVLGFSLTLIGMLIIFSRKMVITKIVGYLTMENGAVLLSLFVAELPFLIEIFVLIDLIMLVLVAAILGFGITSSIEELHAKINPFHNWFKRGNKQ